MDPEMSAVKQTDPPGPVHAAAPSANRWTIDTDTVGGYDLPAGASVSRCPYVTHRLPEFWEWPDEFRPERFAAGARARPLPPSSPRPYHPSHKPRGIKLTRPPRLPASSPRQTLKKLNLTK